mmetsp:Transcript_16693/g.34304  ORF Transcript_16693/g.34304 Transcript_16693/m.34304 type:complete len:99 (+) Transcript_16693:1722-2018(+)
MHVGEEWNMDGWMSFEDNLIKSPLGTSRYSVQLIVYQENRRSDIGRSSSNESKKINKCLARPNTVTKERSPICDILAFTWFTSRPQPKLRNFGFHRKT